MSSVCCIFFRESVFCWLIGLKSKYLCSRWFYFFSVWVAWTGELVGVWVFSAVPTPFCTYELGCFSAIFWVKAISRAVSSIYFIDSNLLIRASLINLLLCRICCFIWKLQIEIFSFRIYCSNPSFDDWRVQVYIRRGKSCVFFFFASKIRLKTFMALSLFLQWEMSVYIDIIICFTKI